MDKRARRRLDAHKRGLAVASDNRAPIAASPGGTRALGDLTSEVADIDKLSSEQSDWLNEMRKAFKACAELRQSLYDVLKPVVTLSASVVLDTETAEFMKLPRTQNDGTFIDDARAIWNGLDKNRQAFLDAGLAAHVFVDLPQQIDAFVAAKARARTARERIGLIVSAIGDRLNAGDKSLDVIEAILATSADADPNAVKHLRLATRVGPSQIQAKPAAPAAPATAATPEPTAKPA